MLYNSGHRTTTHRTMTIQVTCLHSKGYEFNITLDHCKSYSEAVDWVSTLPAMRGHKILKVGPKA